MAQQTASDFVLDDKVQHMADPHAGVDVIVMHNHDRDLVRVEWPSGVREWVTPPELKKVER